MANPQTIQQVRAWLVPWMNHHAAIVSADKTFAAGDAHLVIAAFDLNALVEFVALWMDSRANAPKED